MSKTKKKTKSFLDIDAMCGDDDEIQVDDNNQFIESNRNIDFTQTQSKEMTMESMESNNFTLNTWSMEEINRVLGKTHPYRPTFEANLIGDIYDHAQVHGERRTIKTSIEFDPKAVWWKAPLVAWLPTKNLEMLAFFLIWNLCIVMITGNSGACGDYKNFSTTSFCDENYIFRDGNFVFLLGMAVLILLAFRGNQNVMLYQRCNQEWEKLTGAARNLTRQICFRVSTETEKEAWERRRTIGFVSAAVMTLKMHLRNQRNAVPDLGNILVHQDILNIQKSITMPLFCLDNINYFLVYNRNSDKLSAESLESIEGTCLSPMVEAIVSLMSVKSALSPASHTLHTRIIILLFLIFLPLHLVVNYGFYALLFAFLGDLVVLGLESMVTDAENPFGNGPSDMDLDAICFSLYKDLSATLVRVEFELRDQIFDTWEVTRMNEEMIYKATTKELKMLTSMQKVTKQGRAQCVRNATKSLWTESDDSYGTDVSALSQP
eukprot:CAMPEP_0194171544 /NCGR_PEP_ID=MMETSP0154-20130528/6101_1 /TAXON_ID=1049557 /ORGANISM="Thalassiothrix antarctica, Strain L6-D1" /LENGTH=489 /DNA_ID=CAMNT_0038883879 /DNA_START=67 /DNA_END=1536 /DNA_ORIENTATION=+